MRAVPVVHEAALSDDVLPVARQSRVPPSDRVLHVQARVQDQVHRTGVRRVHGSVRLPATGGSHEPAVPVRARRPLARDTHSRRHTQTRPVQGAAAVRAHV